MSQLQCSQQNMTELYRLKQIKNTQVKSQQ